MRTSLLLIPSVVLLLAGCSEAGTPDRSGALAQAPSRSREALAGYDTCRSAEDIGAAIEKGLPGGLAGAEVVAISPAAIARAADAGVPVALPVIGNEGRMTEIEVTPRAANPFAKGAITATKSSDGEADSKGEAGGVAVFDLVCSSGDVCGAITMLDGATAAEATRYEGVLVHDTAGWNFYESAESLLLNATGRRPELAEPCGVVYNGDDQLAMQPEGSDDDPWGGGDPEPDPKPTPKEDGRLEAVIPIMLDADATFYQLDPDTWESRQVSTIFAASLIYGFIEPVTSNKFMINLQIASQETWVKNGPTTKDKVKLTDEINDPNYFMLNHHGKNELSFFFVGYDMTGGIGGRAGSICNVSGYDEGFGTSYSHQKNHAWGQQVPDMDGGYQFSTLFGRTAVAAHELGHILGAVHEDGELNACAGGAFPNLCGCTLMLSGAAGGLDPDFRKPFFSDANDDNIVACVGEVY